jgi:hypothetical protein
MKKSYTRLYITMLVQLIFVGSIYAQSTDTDSTLLIQQLKNSKNYYYLQLGDQSRLLNGIKYVPYKNQYYVGHAYFLTSDLQNAGFSYDGTEFYDVPVLFDIYKELLVTKDREGSGYMSLINQKLTRFTIGNHHFEQIIADSTETVIKTGFYEILNNGKTQLLSKRYKKPEEEKSGITMTITFMPNDKFYLLRSNEYYNVSSKGDLLKLLKDKKNDLEKYIKLSKLSFDKNDKEASMIRLVIYYNQITS